MKALRSSARLVHGIRCNAFQFVSFTLCRKLHHPNVVKILAICDDELAILMEFVDGGDLRMYLTREHPPFKRRVAFGLDIARGMSYIHECKLFHCDLKCDNVFLDSVRC